MKHFSLFRSGIVLMLLGLTLPGASGCSDDDGPDNPAPKLTLNEATNITRITATVTGRIDGNAETITACGFMYSTAESDMFVAAASDAHRYELTPSTGTVEATLTGLTAGATYYYCLYAIAGRTTVKSEIKKFVTADSSLPMLADVSVVSVGENEIRVQSRVLDAGSADQELPLIGFEYKLINETAYVAKYIKAFDEGSFNTFTLTLDGLKPGSTYCIRSTASNTAKGVGYSDTIQVQTATMQAPVVVTHEAGSVGMNWVEVSGEIENPGTSAVVEQGFCWSSLNDAPEVDDNHLEVTEADGQTFTATVTDLKPNTTYYLRAYAANGTGESKRYGYGKTIEFTTDGFRAPVFASPITVSDLTVSSARVSCSIEDAGNGTITERGFCYSNSNPAPSLNDRTVQVTSGGLSYSTQLQDLETATTYYVRAYAKSQMGQEEAVSYSEPLIFSTLGYDEPGFSSLNATDITDHTARLSAEFYAGTGTVIEKGFCWSTSANPTLENGDSSVTVSGSTMETTLTGLNPQTTYYYRAYATYQAGSSEPKTIYSDYRSFVTESVTMPILDKPEAYPVTAYTATVYSGFTNYSDAVTEFGFCWSKSVQLPKLEDCDESVAIANQEDYGFKYQMEGLTPNTHYYISAYAKVLVNGETTVIYASSSFDTNGLQVPILDIVSVEENLGTSLTVYSYVDEEGDEEVTEVGFCYTLDPNADLATCPKVVTTYNGSRSPFSATITGTTPGQTYYIYGYAVSKAGTGYSYRPCVVTTKAVPGKGDNESPDNP